MRRRLIKRCGVYAAKLFIPAMVLISLPAFCQQGNPSIQYKLEYLTNRIHVEMNFQPSEPDSASFSYGVPAFGGQNDIFSGLQNLEADAPVAISIDSNRRTILFKYAQMKSFRINYDIADTRRGDNTRNQLFRPIIMPGYIYVHGINLFLSPNFKSADSSYRVSIEWKKKPAFKLFYTFDPDNDGTQVVCTTWDSVAFRLITGADDLEVKKFPAESGDNYLVLRTTGIKASLENEITDFYLHYNAGMREFWNDKRIIKYSLVLQPFMNVDHFMSGVSFGNGFIGKYNRPDSIAMGERRAVIAHEVGHYYMSDLEAWAGKNNEGQWFNEGFNDYLTYFNLVRSNIMKAGEFEKVFNKIFNSLYTSSIKNTPNDKIFENFWKLGDYAKLPYWRGEIFAFYLDNQISIATNNKSNLRNLMLDLKKTVKSRSQIMFTNQEFINAVNKYLPGKLFGKKFEDFITSGNPIDFDSPSLLTFYKINTKGKAPVLTITNARKFLTHFQHK
jgi:hypothetical protein